MKTLAAATLTLALFLLASCNRSEYPPAGTRIIVQLKQGLIDKELEDTVAGIEHVRGRLISITDEWIVVDAADDDPEDAGRHIWVPRKNVKKVIFLTRDVKPIKK